MQIYGFTNINAGSDALEEEFDDKVAEYLAGQQEITAEQVKDAWLAYNDFADYLMADDDEYDVDITSFNNSVYGHMLSQFPSIKI